MSNHFQSLKKTIQNFFDSLSENTLASKFINFHIEPVIQAISQAAENIKQFDSLKTELQMMSGISDTTANSLMQSYNTLAKDLSVTTKSVAEASNQFLQMGEDIASVNDLVQSSQILSKTGMIEQADAADYLRASLNGYQLAAADALTVVSKLTAVNEKANISAGSLAEAIALCADSAHTAGTSIDRLAGYTAVIGKSTEQSMSEAGNSLSAMFSRFNSLKSGKLADEQTGESLSDLNILLNSLGIRLQDTANSYLTFDKVLDQVSKSWDTMTKTEQDALSAAIDGSNQGRDFAALMDNYSAALDYSKTAAGAAGNALQQYGIYQDSIEAKTNELTAALEALFTDTISEGACKSILDATTGLVKMLDTLGLIKGALAGIVAMGASKALVSMTTGIMAGVKSTSQLTNAMTSIRNDKSTSNLKLVGSQSKDLSDKQLKLLLSGNNLDNGERETILKGMGKKKTERKQILSSLASRQNQNNPPNKPAFSLKGAGQALAVAAKANPIGAVTTGIAAAVTIISTISSMAKRQKEEAAQALKNAVSEYDSIKSNLDNINSRLKEQETIKNKLLAKEHLTYAEKGQLEELQAITGEMKLQADLEEKKLKRASREVAEKTIENHKKGYGQYDVSNEELDKKQEAASADGYFLVSDGEYDITGNISLYTKYQKLIEETRAKLKQALKEDDGSEGYDRVIKDYEDSIRDYEEGLNDTSEVLEQSLGDLTTQRSDIRQQYNEAVKKQNTGQILAPAEQDIIKTYEDMSNAIKMIYESLDPNAWNELEISNILDSPGIERTKTELIEMAKVGKITPEMLKDYPKLNNAIKDSELILEDGTTAAQSFCEQINALARASGVYGASFKFSGFTEEQSKALDDFNNKMQKLGEARLKIQYGDTSGMADLIREFPELQGKTENLDEALNELAEQSFAKVQDTLGEHIPPEVKDDLETIKNAATGAAPLLSESFDRIQSSYSALEEMKNAMASGNLTDSVLSSISALDPVLNDLVSGFHSGAVSANELCQALQNHYNVDLQNYGNALIEKNRYSKDFYQSLVLTDAESVNAFLENYGIDLRNCQTVNDAKVAIAAATVQKIASIWSQYYHFRKEDRGLNDTAILNSLEESASHGDAMARAQLAAIEQQEAIQRQAEEDLNKIIYSSASKNLGDIGSKLDTAAKSPGSGSAAESAAKETAETFNFIETLLSRLSDRFSRLKSAGENTFKSLAARAGAYTAALDVVKNQISTHTQAYNTYMAKANEVGLDEYWAAQVRDGSLSIADVTDENLKQKIKDYQTWYEKALACGSALEDLNRQQTELVQAKIELVISKYDSLLQQMSGANDRIQNKIGIKEAWGFTAGKANYTTMNKNIIKQIGYTARQNAGLKELLPTVEKTSQAWYEYSQRLDANKASQQELKKAMAKNAKAAAALAGEKAAAKAEKYDAKNELYDAKIDNAVSAKSKNKQIDKKISQINKKDAAYQNALKTDKKNLSGARKNLSKWKSTKENKSLLKKIRKYTKASKRIPKDLLDKAYKLKDNGKLYNACLQYNSYFDAVLADKETADLFKETAKQEKADLAMEKFNNISTEYDQKMAANQQKKTSIQNRIALAEEQGHSVSASHYKNLISAESAEQKKQEEKRKALQNAMNKALADGSIKKGSEEWYSMAEAINEVTNAIDESTKSLAEYQNALRQLQWDAFDAAMETAKRINSEADFYLNLMDSEKMTDEGGSLTKYGSASLNLHQAKYRQYIAQAKAYQKEYQELMASGDLNDKNVIARLRELEDAQRDALLSAKDENNSIIDLIRASYDAQLESLSGLISKFKDLKQNEKDAYEYQKNIAEKTKNIASLQKQLQAYGANDTEEARAKVQKLKVELDAAQEELKETEYDKYLSDTSEMLDSLYSEYEALVDEKFNDTNELLEKLNASSETAASTITTLNELLAGVSSDGSISVSLKNAIENPDDVQPPNPETENGGAPAPTPESQPQPPAPAPAGNAPDLIQAVERRTPESTLWNNFVHDTFNFPERANTSGKNIIPESARISTPSHNNSAVKDIWGDPIIDSSAHATTRVSNPSAQNFSVNLGGITVNGVNDPEEFGRQLRNEIANNGKTAKLIAESTSSLISPRGSGNTNLWK